MSVIALLTAIKAESVPTCTALVLSGGASRGAWEAGVLWGLTHYGDPNNFKYDVVTGVSAGSINAIVLAGWPIGQEKEFTETLTDLWRNLKNENVWKKWASEIIEGFFIKRGLLDDSPLLPFLNNTIMTNFTDYARPITIAAAEVNTGDYFIFNQTNVPYN